MSRKFLSKAMRQAARGNRQLRTIVQTEGYAGLSKFIRRVAADKIRPRNMAWEVFPEDVAAADLTRPIDDKSFPVRASEQISLGWITSPASAGSGGHTTLFRIVNYLQSRGFRNTIYFYDTYGGDHQYYAEVARESYGVKCEIKDYRDGLADSDGIIATSWPTAYAAYASPCKGVRFYFVQDYEPSFYPVSASSLLAENTYRMGFHAITAGKWLASKLRGDFDHSADYFPFGCDTSRYKRSNEGKRNGVAFYARASTPRRGVELGLLALKIFSERNPGVNLYLYGDDLENLPFKFVNYGRVSPAELNDIYNRCFAGLSLSLTNVSLVPQEMLAAGCIPVVNDAEHNRIVLDNECVVYSEPTPHALAASIENVMRATDFEAMSKKAAESVGDTSWDDAGAAVEKAIRQKIDEKSMRSLK